MNGINNELDSYIAVKSCTNNTGCTVSERSHSIEKMCCVLNSCIDTCHCCFIISRSMSHRNHNICITTDFTNCTEIFCVSFRGKSDYFNYIFIFFYNGSIRFKDIFCILSTFFAFADKRTFSVTTKNSTTLPSFAFFF